MHQELQHKIDFKTKPIGSLGMLENIALQIGNIQNTLSPTLVQPTIIIFAADHGIAKEGVSAYPQEVTYQMVMNFVQQGAAINVFCEQNNIDLKIVDAGVNFDFNGIENIINAKIANGTASFSNQKAMSELELKQCFDHGKLIVNNVATTGCNIIGFGEMGIGNTSAASLIMSEVCKMPLDKCIGRGTGVNDDQLQNKLDILQHAKNYHGLMTDPKEILQTYGGFEIAQMASAMLTAYEHKMIIMIDGFIASSAFLIAHQMNPALITNAIFCHVSHESGHPYLLDFLKVKPILNLGMRLGEGTGCAVAYPIIKSAVHFLNNMASFESAGVANKA